MRDRILSAVATIASDLADRVEVCERLPSEAILWRELTTCILSSQVRFEVAQAFSRRISRARMLVDWADGERQLRRALLRQLTEPAKVSGRLQRYRFPVSKASQIAAAWRVFSRLGSIRSRLSACDDAVSAREWLVSEIQGLGPKQASMFLRNVGLTVDLAILDRHVVSYMRIAGMGGVKVEALSRLHGYMRREDDLRKHADLMFCSVGALDGAIWVVMRVFQRDFRHEDRSI